MNNKIFLLTITFLLYPALHGASSSSSAAAGAAAAAAASATVKEDKQSAAAISFVKPSSPKDIISLTNLMAKGHYFSLKYAPKDAATGDLARKSRFGLMVTYGNHNGTLENVYPWLQCKGVMEEVFAGNVTLDLPLIVCPTMQPEIVTKIEDWDNSKFSWQPRANKAYIISLAPNSSNTGVVPTLAA